MNSRPHAGWIMSMAGMALFPIATEIVFSPSAQAQEVRVNCPLWPMMQMSGGQTMYVSNEYLVLNGACTQGPYLSMWYGVFNGTLPAVCPNCDPVAAPAETQGVPRGPVPDPPAADAASSPAPSVATTACCDTGDPFPGYEGGMKNIGFRPHERPTNEGGFPDFGPDSRRPNPANSAEKPIKFVEFEWKGETIQAMLLRYTINPWQVCKDNGGLNAECNKLKKGSDSTFEIIIGYQVDDTGGDLVETAYPDPYWELNHEDQEKVVRLLLADEKRCLVLLAE